VSEKEGRGEWDGVCLAVGLRRSVVPGLEVQGEEWEDVCMEGGFEFVDGEVKGRGRDKFGGRWGGDLFCMFCYFFSCFISLMVRWCGCGCGCGCGVGIVTILPLAIRGSFIAMMAA
jgi:hypothetical protein